MMTKAQQRELFFDVWELDILAKRLHLSAKHRAEWNAKFSKVNNHFKQQTTKKASKGNALEAEVKAD